MNKGLLIEIFTIVDNEYVGDDDKEASDEHNYQAAYQILAKIREVVEGAGLTDEVKARLWKQAQKEGSNPMCEFTPDELMTELVIEAQLQAILKALDKEV